MTAIEQWAVELARGIAQDDVAAGRSIETTLEQRLAIALMQARATEARHWSGQLLIHLPHEPIARELSARLSDRSHKLEAIALEMCTVYPPTTEPVGPRLVRPA